MLGSDYEVFLTSSSTGIPVPATVLGLNGKSGAHRPLFLDGQDVGTIHRDNLMAEICPHPKSSAKDFADAVRMSFLGAQQYLTSFDEDLRISTETAVSFPERAINTKEGNDIGCDRDYISNFDSAARPQVTTKILQNVRCAGGHLHVSYDTGLIPPWVAAELADLFVGFPARHRLNPIRAPYYGLASLHRPTVYPDGSCGMEYRVLDSFWVHDDQILADTTRRMELVQSLLVQEYIPAIQMLLAAYHRLVPQNSIVAFYDCTQILLETSEIMRTVAPELLEEFNDTI